MATANRAHFPIVRFASRRAIARQIERPRIRTAGRRQAMEIQRDLEKLLAAAVIEQAVFFRAIGSALMEEALRSFRAGTQFLALPHNEQRAMAVLTERIARLLAAARVLGKAQVRRQADLPLRSSVSFGELDSVGPARAVEYLRGLPVMTRRQWEAAVQAQQSRAFTIAGVNQRAALEGMRELIAHSLESGLTPRQFEQRATELLRNFETTAGKLRTIWNTNVGQALASGRKEELDKPEIAALIPYRLFDAMNDQFTRPNHLLLDGGIAPWNWEGWARNGPLLGFNCRCVVLGISRARAERMITEGSGFDLTLGVPAGAGPDPGFK